MLWEYLITDRTGRRGEGINANFKVDGFRFETGKMSGCLDHLHREGCSALNRKVCALCEYSLLVAFLGGASEASKILFSKRFDRFNEILEREISAEFCNGRNRLNRFKVADIFIDRYALNGLLF